MIGSTQGEDSPYVWSRGEVVERIRRKTSDETLANPTFKLGVYFLVQGNETLARHYWEAAQQLAPDNWNFHRQDWNLTEGLAGPKLREKMGALGAQPFYAPLALPLPQGSSRQLRASGASTVRRRWG